MKGVSMELLKHLRQILIDSGIKVNGKLSMEMHLQKDLNIDSIDLFGVLNEIEQSMGIEIEEEEMDTVRTVGAFIELVQNKQNEKVAVN
jgi:acyl carrier protein